MMLDFEWWRSIVSYLQVVEVSAQSLRYHVGVPQPFFLARCRQSDLVIVTYHEEICVNQPSFFNLIFSFLANHFRLPILVSRCAATGCPPATSVVLILLRYVSTDPAAGSAIVSDSSYGWVP